MKRCLGLFLVLVFSSVMVGCGEMPKDPVSQAGLQLVSDFVNDSCSNELDKGFVFQKYLHPDFEAPGNDNFDFLVVERNFKILKAGLIQADKNVDHPKIETLLKVTVQFQEVGYFDPDKGFVAEKKPFPFSYYLSKYKGRYLILSSDDPDRVICFYDEALKDIQKNPKRYPNPPKILELLKQAHSS